MNKPWPKTSDDTVGRAFELARSAEVGDVQSLIRKLRLEGHQNAMTDLRSVLLRRELKSMIEARIRVGAPR